MSANTNDKISDTRNSARPNSAKASGTRSAGGTTLACDSLTGWPTVSKVHFVTYKIDANSNPVAGSQLDCTGVVSGNSLTSIVVVDGTDAGNAVNDVVEMLPTANWGHELFTALTKEHNQLDGSHKSITTDTITVTSGSTLPAGDIATADIAAGAITTAKLATGIQPTTVESNPYKFSAYMAGAANTGNNAFAAIPFDTELFDTGNNHSSTGVFTAPIAGFYQFNWNAEVTLSAGASETYVTELYKNGVGLKRGSLVTHPGTASSTLQGSHGSALVQLAANDTVTIQAFAPASRALNVSSSDRTWWDGYLVSAT